MMHLTIRKKLWSLTLFFLLIFAMNGALSAYFAQKVVAHLNPAGVEVLKEVVLLNRYVEMVESDFNSAVETGQMEFLQKIDRLERQFSALTENLKAYDPDFSEEYEKIGNLFAAYVEPGRKLTEMLISNSANATDAEISEIANRVKAILPELKGGLEILEDAKYQEFQKLQHKMEEISQSHVKIDFLATLAVILFSLVTAPLIVRSITRPLAELVRATKELGAGNLFAKAEVRTRDEIGALAESFNSTTEKLRLTQVELSKTNEILQETNEQLKKSDKHKTEFLASMSHELRTPLNAIINFTDQIIEDWKELDEDAEWNAEAKDMLERVLKSSRHLLALINDLLDLAKIEAGKMKLDLTENDMGLLVSETVHSVRSLADAKGIALRHTIQPGLPIVVCDERKIHQLILNLLSNAIKFTERGEVHAKVFRDGGRADGLIIEVQDTGIGIPSDSLESIFDRFRQVDGSDSKKFRGTGLGLNLVKEIVGMHGGTVTVESQPGKGSCFRVFLPYQYVQKEIAA